MFLIKHFKIYLFHINLLLFQPAQLSYITIIHHTLSFYSFKLCLSIYYLSLSTITIITYHYYVTVINVVMIIKIIIFIVITIIITTINIIIIFYIV